MRVARVVAAASMLALAVAYPAAGAANFVILSIDAPGIGFNDPTPVTPVGGNSGTTLGAQRLIAVQHAANLWGAVLDSSVAIVVSATFTPLSCTATSALFGSGSPRSVYRDFSGAPIAGHWYVNALANKLAGIDLSTGNPSPAQNAEIQLSLNRNLGQPACLAGRPFYLGLDNAHGTAVDLIDVVLHELAHGLGFYTTTNAITGAQHQGFPSIFDRFLFDTTANLAWNQMSNAQRAASAINTFGLVWTGTNVTQSAPVVLSAPTPELAILVPDADAARYEVSTASFGPPLDAEGVTAQMMPLVDTDACAPLVSPDTLAVAGQIALVDRGTCAFAVKVKNAQNAGAVAVVIVDNVTSGHPPTVGGTDPTVVIPSLGITQSDGATLRAALRHRSRTRSGVLASLRLDPTRPLGTNELGFVQMFAPNPFISGSSVAHWEIRLFPDQSLEAGNPPTATHSVMPPNDLALPALRDLGW